MQLVEQVGLVEDIDGADEVAGAQERHPLTAVAAAEQVAWKEGNVEGIGALVTPVAALVQGKVVTDLQVAASLGRLLLAARPRVEYEPGAVICAWSEQILGCRRRLRRGGRLGGGVQSGASRICSIKADVEAFL